jgi:hypothetical protein
MILLRLLSFVAGGLVMVVPPMYLSGGTGGPVFDGPTAIAAMAGLALVASSYFFIGFAGDRMRKSPLLRFVGALLLAVPCAAAGAVLWHGGEEPLLWLSALLFCCTAVLFVTFVVPVERPHKQRPMRRRESLAG